MIDHAQEKTALRRADVIRRFVRYAGERVLKDGVGVLFEKPDSKPPQKKAA